MSGNYKTFFLLLVCSCAVSCIVSCQTMAPAEKSLSPAQLTYLQDKPAALRASYENLLRDGERNSVLNQMQIGKDAIELGYLNLAQVAFDAALNKIERVYANDPQAARARSLWEKEGCKDFKGEPYERVMAYYYRGLLYIWKHDYQNARACFKAGMLQDAFAEEQQYRCDFALMLYLNGWCSQRIHDTLLSRQAFGALLKLRPDVVLPHADDNVLLIIETGKAPRKVSDGVGHYELKYRRGRNFKEKRVRYTVDQQSPAFAYPMEDIYWQADTRGGRQVDYILKGKAHFKQQTAMVGSVLSEAAATSMLSATVFQNSAPELQGAGAALGLVSVASQYISQRARAQADTRYWHNLPDAVHTASLKLSPGKHRITLDFLDGSGRLIPKLRQTFSVSVPGNNESKLIWRCSRKQID